MSATAARKGQLAVRSCPRGWPVTESRDGRAPWLSGRVAAGIRSCSHCGRLAQSSIQEPRAELELH